VRRDPRRALKTCELALVRRGCSPATVEAVLRMAGALLSECGKPVKAIDAGDVRAHLAGCARAELSPNTQQAVLVRLRIFFKALVEEGLLPSDPTAGLRVQVGSAQPQLVLTQTQVARLLKTASDASRYASLSTAEHLARPLALRDRALFELLYATGLRRQELANARVVDLRLQEGSLVVRRAKGGESRALPLPLPAVEHLLTYLRNSRPVLAAESSPPTDHLLLGRAGAAILPDGIYQIVRRVGQAAGLEVTTHALRRSVATHLVQAGVTVEAVRQLLGHSDLASLVHYVRLEQTELAKAVRALDLTSARLGPTTEELRTAGNANRRAAAARVRPPRSGSPCPAPGTRLGRGTHER